TATSLPDGSVLLAGGQADTTCCLPHAPVASMERYVPGTGFVNAGSLIAARYVHTATALKCPSGSPGCSYGGKVLLAGTYGWSQLAGFTAELYDPAAAVPLASAAAPDGHNGAAYAGFTLAGQGG